MNLHVINTNPRPAASHRRDGTQERQSGGGVLTLEPTAICRARGRTIGAGARPINPGVSRTFAIRCASRAVAMRRRFDRIREVRNCSIYQVILDRRWVLESALSLPGRVHPGRHADAGVTAAASCTRKLSNQHEFPMSRRDPPGAARRRRTQVSAGDAWYVDCSSRPRGPAEGEEIK
jgi:hypothetical protein